MITPFRLYDLLLLKQLQKLQVPLCPVEALTRPQSPLWTALSSLLAFEEMRSLTFVLNEQRRDSKHLRGFIQAKQPPTRPDMYIQYLAPRLDGDEDAHAVWNRLLNHIFAQAADQGIQRFFACVPEETPEIELLRGAGFSAYTREEIWVLAPDTHPQAVAQKGIRAEQSTDQWEIHRLYRSTVPHLVQQAEALTDSKGSEWLSGPVEWSQGEGFVFEDPSGIVGYGHLMPGRTGHWLSILIHPRAFERVGKLLDYGLALLNYYPPYPVYCAVRPYQAGILDPLRECGFTWLSEQCRMVKHNAIRVKETARSLVPSLEKRVEAPTTTVSPTEGP